MKCRIGELVLFRVRRRISEKDFAKSAFGRELAALKAETHEAPADYKFEPISLKGAPMPYEIQFRMSNWADCQDWIRENYQKFIQHSI
jgi:hypothetical protein